MPGIPGVGKAQMEQPRAIQIDKSDPDDVEEANMLLVKIFDRLGEIIAKLDSMDRPREYVGAKAESAQAPLSRPK